MLKLKYENNFIHKLIGIIYRNNLIEKIVHTLPYNLKKGLKDCSSVLDLGCGPSSPIQYCKNIKHSVGVEIYKPSLQKSMEAQIHSIYINKNIQDLSLEDFEENSFDAVILIEAIEHLPKEDALVIIEKACKWAKKRVILTTPNGFYGGFDDKYLANFESDNNINNVHVSGFQYSELKKLGFDIYGGTGLKIFYNQLRFEPFILWKIIAGFSQVFAYYMPNYAFEFFAVLNLNK